MNNLLNYMTDIEFNYIKNEKDLYKKSKILVAILFIDKLDTSSGPNIGHMLRVSNSMSTLEGKIAGLLHEVIENIEFVTFDDLIDIGITQDIIEILKIVTKKPYKKNIKNKEKNILNNKEIERIINSKNKVAIELKLCDMKDIIEEYRLRKINVQTQEWIIKKYKNNIKKLMKVKGE